MAACVNAAALSAQLDEGAAVLPSLWPLPWTTVAANSATKNCGAGQPRRPDRCCCSVADSQSWFGISGSTRISNHCVRSAGCYDDLGAFCASSLSLALGTTSGPNWQCSPVGL